MRLSTTVNYLNQLITDNDSLIIEISRSKRIWYFLNFLLRYPALVMIAIIGILSSATLTQPHEYIQIIILILSIIVSILNTTHAFLQPDSQIKASENVCGLLEGLNSDLRMGSNELTVDVSECLRLGDENRRLEEDDIRRYQLIVTKFELNRSHIMKSMPSRLFVRSTGNKNLARKNGAFDATPETSSSELAV